MRPRRAAFASALAGSVLAGTALVAGCAAAPVSRAASTGFYLTPASATRSCYNSSLPVYALDYLSSIQFVSADRGWVVGEHEILATSDGGHRWTVQERGNLDLASVDFINATTGWAVGPDRLLTTSDGGERWTALRVPCLSSVHFVSPSTGFAISDRGGSFGLIPAPGAVLKTTDGGRTWRPMPASPADALTVCFNNAEQGWLGAGGQAGKLYRTEDGGRTWQRVTGGDQSPAAGYTMAVQCAGADAVWAIETGNEATMSKQPYVGYIADAAGTEPLFAEQAFAHSGVRAGAEAPGPYAGPVAAISPASAVFLGYCPACGFGTVSWDLVTGITVTRDGNVSGIDQAEAASFVSPRRGWVLGVVPQNGPKGSFEQRIMGTSDGGQTWRLLYRS
jgi:photosystem II stability/assembly factor-like uncharacterized protein